MINWFDVSDESPNKDLALKNLKVTQNGTYGESGVAYSSVEVNVSGGGSSDFIEAEVVITTQSDHLHMIPSTLEDTEITTGFVWGVSGVTIPAQEVDFPTGTYKCYIKSGEYIGFYINSITEAAGYIVTGNAEVIPGSSGVPAVVKVTGNCTITTS